ncbi:hypothetical protein D9M72_381280 [compost metagenome]
MVHRVVAVGLGSVDRHLLGVDAETLDHLHHLVGRAGNAGDALGNVGDVLAEDFGRVALGIDGDEIGLQLVAFRVDLFQPAVQFEQRRRADFRAMGEAEEKRGRLAGKRLLGNLLAVLRDQREGNAEGAGGGLLLRLGHFIGQPAQDARHDDDGSPEDDADGFHACYRFCWGRRRPCPVDRPLIPPSPGPRKWDNCRRLWPGWGRGGAFSPSSGLPATFSPQAGRRNRVAHPCSTVILGALTQRSFSSPLPACGERVRVRGGGGPRSCRAVLEAPGKAGLGERQEDIGAIFDPAAEGEQEHNRNRSRKACGKGKADRALGLRVHGVIITARAARGSRAICRVRPEARSGRCRKRWKTAPEAPFDCARKCRETRACSAYAQTLK